MSLIWILAGLISGILLWSELRLLPGSSLRQLADNNDREQSLGKSAHEAKRMTISVIIPARNEEKNIGRLLKSLREQMNPQDEIIVVDDNSSDRTAEIAHRRGAMIIKAGPLPRGWMGKCHACWRGAAAANGEMLIFLDADTYLKKGGLSQLVDAYPSGLMSVQPFHDTWSAYEKLSGIFNIIVAVSAGSGKKGTGAYGPCVVTSREAYDNVGGHEQVKGEILDHHALALRFEAAGYPVVNYIGRGALHFRMYPGGVRELFQGWIKSMASGAAATRFSKLFTVVLFLMGAFTAALSLLSWDYGIMSVVVYGLYSALMAGLLGKVGKFGAISAILYPVPLLAFFSVFSVSILHTFVNRQVRWKGRELTLDPEENQ
ncbi:glycosyltransferase [Paenibacillus shunpengii]|uniref:4,4'-diaponeurosporenoate glycosyltransferase n=1 Tax=Paenibacillus shunpengii TaxID=2054424 RepID=A0ABW5SPB9_9BACL|nr:glycosyltransferase family 2 protein [Paenibacillus sp. FSL H7-0326]